MMRLLFLLATASLLGLAAPANPEPLGRLFFSPDERAVLDRQRQGGVGAGTAATAQITLNGVVRRSSGKTTAWINQAPQHENENRQGVALGPAARPPGVPLLLSSGRQVNLKAGQTFDTATGRIREGYQGSEGR